MRDIPFQRSIYHASADFAHRWMTHRSLGVGGYGFGGPRACPWGSIRLGLILKERGQPNPLPLTFLWSPGLLFYGQFLNDQFIPPLPPK